MRDPRVADIPRPSIEIGDVDLQLDVRFTATSELGTRELETKNISSTLTQSDEKSFSNTDSSSHEFTASVAVEQGWAVGSPLSSGAEGSVKVETGYTGQWTSSYTQESTQATQEEVAESFETEVETTENETTQREVVGASMKVGLTIKALGDIAFQISNLQVTVFVQDPKNPARLIPVATLVPDANVPNNFTLGPLVPERGPFIFESDQIFPSVIEQLMLNPLGMTFKIANYDITDEQGRNFAFTSQEINDITSPLVIDFGSADHDGDGIGDGASQLRVATSSGRVIDTNGDNIIDDNDRRVSFDLDGNAVGLTLSEALEVIIGLKRYSEEETPSSGLSEFQRETSFSTKVVDGLERIWRIRNVSQNSTTPLKKWYVFTSTGIDVTTPFSDLILEPGSGIRLAFVQDLDDDLVTAAWEFVHGCSDVNPDTDGDGLQDGFEIYEGWDVDVVGLGVFRSYSSCAREDTDLDGVLDIDEKERLTDIDMDGDGTPDLFDIPAPTDARNPDTDGDGVTDSEEINGYLIKLRFSEGGPDEIIVTSDPLNPDTDGDTVKDGEEQELGIDPTVPDEGKVLDDDGDSLRNFEEELGWTVTFFQNSTESGKQGAQVTCTPTSFLGCELPPTSNPLDADTDGDGLTDDIEKRIGTHPKLTDTDDDGLTDLEENITDTDPLDADYDNDRRQDGAEANNPITVSVVGETPFQVFSNPFEADEDLDGLDDKEEEILGTNPTLPKGFDTDEDGVGDSVEDDRGTNPLEADQKVNFAFTNIHVIGDCDEGDDGSDQWSGKLKARKNTNTTDELFNLHNSDLDSTHEGQNLPLSNASVTYILKSGDIVDVFSEDLCESDWDDDGQCGGSDDELQNFSEPFSYPVRTQNKLFDQKGGDGCRLKFSLTITEVID